jgi:hypothetical protein
VALQLGAGYGGGAGEARVGDGRGAGDLDEARAEDSREAERDK